LLLVGLISSLALGFFSQTLFLGHSIAFIHPKHTFLPNITNLSDDSNSESYLYDKEDYYIPETELATASAGSTGRPNSAATARLEVVLGTRRPKPVDLVVDQAQGSLAQTQGAARPPAR
jgi:hypothetical protein